jgi:hypothetical protein
MMERFNARLSSRPIQQVRLENIEETKFNPKESFFVPDPRQAVNPGGYLSYKFFMTPQWASHQLRHPSYYGPEVPLALASYKISTITQVSFVGGAIQQNEIYRNAERTYYSHHNNTPVAGVMPKQNVYTLTELHQEFCPKELIAVYSEHKQGSGELTSDALVEKVKASHYY